MKNNYQVQKNIYFLFIIILGLSYIFFLTSLGIGLFNACMSKLILVTGVEFNADFLSSYFYIYLGVGMIYIALLAKSFKGIFKLIYKIRKTNNFLNSLDIERYDDFNLINSTKQYAFTKGFFEPQVFLSRGLVDCVNEKELNAIKLHEVGHAISFDPLKILIVEIIEELLAWFPYKSMIFSQYKLLTELCADENAVDAMDSRKPVVSALYKVLSSDNLVYPGFSTNSERIGILVGNSKFSARKFIAYSCLMIVVISTSSLMMNKTQPFNVCDGVESCFVEEYLASNDFVSGKSCVKQKVVRNYSPALQSIGN